MCRDWVSNPGPLAFESIALPTALHARQLLVYDHRLHMKYKNSSINVSCFSFLLLRNGMLKSMTNGQTDLRPRSNMAPNFLEVGAINGR